LYFSGCELARQTSSSVSVRSANGKTVPPECKHSITGRCGARSQTRLSPTPFDVLCGRASFLGVDKVVKNGDGAAKTAAFGKGLLESADACLHAFPSRHRIDAAGTKMLKGRCDGATRCVKGVRILHPTSTQFNLYLHPFPSRGGSRSGPRNHTVPPAHANCDAFPAGYTQRQRATRHRWTCSCSICGITWWGSCASRWTRSNMALR
jgi:hypothetical protein